METVNYMRDVVAWKPFQSDLGVASVRLRSFLPCENLNKIGIRCEFFSLTRMDSYKLVIFQKSYTEEDIQLAIKLKDLGVKTVIDICDNHFYNPAGRDDFEARAARLKQMINLVDAVVVPTQELKKVVEPLTGSIFVVDDFIDYEKSSHIADLFNRARTILTHYRQIKRLRSRKIIRLVWYGNQGNPALDSGISELVSILPQLEKLNIDVPLSLTVITNNKGIFQREIQGVTTFPTHFFKWEKGTFPYLFKEHDICIIPVKVNPFTICKSNNRLVLSLKLGLPVVADLIPSYVEFSDFVLKPPWVDAIALYANNIKLRESHVKAGRNYIEKNCTVPKVISQWKQLIDEVI